MNGKSLLRLDDLTVDEIGHLLDVADRFRETGIPKAREGRVELVNLRVIARTSISL